ncbi:hypothetical protein DFR50_101257 [Roseiarcus fermentans]|uniref:Uncharacterized protein n=1 Tax=Roseiarcus fermentans TaxID=1473586 RepID=A0A366FUG3_9HYPH|nr:hypothetical protein DFR50_101257 [Roseiarcus fermentans]
MAKGDHASRRLSLGRQEKLTMRKVLANLLLSAAPIGRMGIQDHIVLDRSGSACWAAREAVRIPAHDCLWSF